MASLVYLGSRLMLMLIGGTYIADGARVFRLGHLSRMTPHGLVVIFTLHTFQNRKNDQAVLSLQNIISLMATESLMSMFEGQSER